MSPILFYFDVVSPYTFLAESQVSRLEQETGRTIEWVPIFLGGLMKATGNRPPGTVPAKARWMVYDLRRWTAEYGLPLQIPSAFPTNTLLAQRVLVQLPQEERQTLAFKLSTAYWGEGKDIGNPELLAEILADLGLDTSLLDSAKTPEVKAMLTANTEQAAEHGAFGAPSFVCDGQLFFGNDRLHHLVAHATRQG